jgi:hypothetical protein
MLRRFLNDIREVWGKLIWETAVVAIPIGLSLVFASVFIPQLELTFELSENSVGSVWIAAVMGVTQIIWCYTSGEYGGSEDEQDEEKEEGAPEKTELTEFAEN